MLGSPDQPLRCSKLGALVKCSVRVHMIDVADSGLDDSAGAPAQTGSLTHAGVAAFHLFKGTDEERKKAAWDAIAANAAKFPLAEKDEVRLFITPYMNDPRNKTAQCLAVETQVDFTLPPHPLDMTGQPIHCQGTFDQVRIWDGEPTLMDLKTGRKTGWEMLHDYAIQQAAYLYGIRNSPQLGNWFDRIKTGYLIRAHGYRTRSVESDAPVGVFWAFPFTMDEVDLILEPVRLAVAMYRNGQITFGTGPHCTYCEFGGLLKCIRTWRNYEQTGKVSLL